MYRLVLGIGVVFSLIGGLMLILLVLALMGSLGRT